jgi:hypothetical protein
LFGRRAADGIGGGQGQIRRILRIGGLRKAVEVAAHRAKVVEYFELSVNEMMLDVWRNFFRPGIEERLHQIVQTSSSDFSSGPTLHRAMNLESALHPSEACLGFVVLSGDGEKLVDRDRRVSLGDA